jgi:hypothetical protein
MKKFLTVLISILLVLGSVAGLTACGSASFDAPTMVNHGKIVNGRMGSFLAETENYVYFINGEGDLLADNTFGAPVKGSLMVLDKASLAEGKVESEIVVPKLFITKDSGAGVYLFGSGEETYAYYATPNVNKNAQGEIAKSELSIARTRLDSKKTEILLNLSSQDAEYRMVEKDGVVYIVYYDGEDSTIKVYDTASKKSNVIAKTDETTNQATTVNGKQVYLSFGAYKMLDNQSDYQVAYTMIVYNEKYYEDKASEEYTRQTAKYNLVYLYSAGSEPVLVLDGSKTNETFELKFVENDYLFYTSTDLYSNVKTYGTLVSETADLTKRAVINQADLLTAGIIINNLGEVYYKTDAAVVKSSLTASAEELFLQKEKIVSATNISSIICFDEGYLYYFNTDNRIARILVSNPDAKEERISVGTASSTFYAPQILTIGENKYMFYLDSSDEGCSYISFVKINQQAEAVYNKDDAEKVDYYTIKGQTLIGKITDADVVKMVVSKISAIGTSVLDFEEKDGVLTVESVTKARAAYNLLSDELKEQVIKADMEKLEKAEKAIELANAYNKLKDVDNYADMTEEQQKAFKDLYQDAYDLRDSLVQAGTDYYKSIRDMVSSDYKYYYQQARKLFAEKK